MTLTGGGRQREYCIEIAFHYAIQVETHKMQIRDICTCRPTDWGTDEMSGSSALQMQEAAEVSPQVSGSRPDSL